MAELFIESKSINIIYNGKAIAGVQSYEYSISQEVGEFKRYSKIVPDVLLPTKRTISLALSRCMMYSNRYTFSDLVNKTFSIQIQKKWSNGKIQTTTFSGCVIVDIKQSSDVSDYVKEAIQVRAIGVSNVTT